MAEMTKVEFRLQGTQQSDPKLWISCQATENVCGDRLVPPIDHETQQQLEGLKIQLADSPATDRPIDILIGLHHLVEFQTHKAVQLTRTLEVVQTALRWTLCGRRNYQVDSKQKRFRQVVTSCLITRAVVMEASTRSERNVEADYNLEKDFRRFVDAEAYPLEA